MGSMSAPDIGAALTILSELLNARYVCTTSNIRGSA